MAALCIIGLTCATADAAGSGKKAKGKGKVAKVAKVEKKTKAPQHNLLQGAACIISVPIGLIAPDARKACG